MELRPISKKSIPAALSRANQYRLLNEPWQAESICRDILHVQADHEMAIVTLVLAITDQFDFTTNCCEVKAREVCDRLGEEYHRIYYSGIISERLGKVALKRPTPRARYIAYEFYADALKYYEQAQKIRPEENEESILRWNACVRRIRDMKLEPAHIHDETPAFLDV